MSGEKFKMELPALAIKDQFPWRKLKVLWMKSRQKSLIGKKKKFRAL